MIRSYLLTLVIFVACEGIGHDNETPVVASSSGPLAVAEIRNHAVNALFAFFQDWSIARVRILQPSLFLELSPSCFSTGSGIGVKYLISNQWDSELGSFGIGPNSCSQNQNKIDDVYDPTLACGPRSRNPFCFEIPSYSVNPPTAGRVYNCEPSTYQTNPYSCMIGDLSGKYGDLLFNVTMLPSTSKSSPTTTTTTPKASPETPALTKSPPIAQLLNVMLEGIGEEAVESHLLHGGMLDMDTNALQEITLSNGKDLVLRIVRDPKSPPVNLLQGKAIVLECSNNSTMACAKITYASNVNIDLARAEILTRLARQRADEQPLQLLPEDVTPASVGPPSLEGPATSADSDIPKEGSRLRAARSASYKDAAVQSVMNNLRSILRYMGAR